MAETKLKARRKELIAMTVPELDAAVEDARRSIYTVKRTSISKPVENTKAIRTARKEIARVMTIKRQREIAAEVAAK